MAHNEKDPRRRRPGGPSYVLCPRRDGREDNRRARRDQARREIVDGVARALREVDAEDRPELMRWVIERGLLGLAHQRGTRDAAGAAYELADLLAGIAT
jgi:hypothetical protein